MNAAAVQVPASDRIRATALLGYAVENRLLHRTVDMLFTVDSPWDVWRICVRADATFSELGLGLVRQRRTCATCRQDAALLSGRRPIGHPDLARCGCPYEWARAMRAPEAEPQWPPFRLAVAVCKPGAPTARIASELARTHVILDHVTRTLTVADTRRMYPDAYGAAFIADRDAYLGSGPSEVLILRQRPNMAIAPKQVKTAIRTQVGTGRLRNHLHMPDNPAEALCDIAHLAGPEVLTNLYEEHERGRAEPRLAFYRAVLGAGASRPDGRRPG